MFVDLKRTNEKPDPSRPSMLSATWEPGSDGSGGTAYCFVGVDDAAEDRQVGVLGANQPPAGGAAERRPQAEILLLAAREVDESERVPVRSHVIWSSVSTVFRVVLGAAGLSAERRAAAEADRVPLGRSIRASRWPRTASARRRSCS